MKPIRVGLLLSSLRTRAWQHEILARIQAGGYAELVLIVVDANHTNEDFSIPTIYRKDAPWIYRCYGWIEQRLFTLDPDPFAQLTVEPADSAAAQIWIRSIEDGPDSIVDAKDIDRIQAHRIDVLLQFGFPSLKGDILQAAKYGIWSVNVQDKYPNSAPIGLFEVLQGNPVTEVSVTMTLEDYEGPVILSRSFVATDHLSVSRNWMSCYWKAGMLVLKCLRELFETGGDSVRSRQLGAEKSQRHTLRELRQLPSVGSFLLQLVSHIARYAPKKLRRSVFDEQWVLLWGFSKHTSSPLSSFNILAPDKTRFWADPHLLYRDGLYYAFFEDGDMKTGKGRIAVLTIDSEGHVSQPTTVLEESFHLSYPHVFEFEDQLYMIPESSADRTIRLYQCVQFPKKWELKETLIKDINAVDTTPFYCYGKWWLFTNVSAHPGISSCDDLYLFYSDKLIGGHWKDHPMNPVVSDARVARPGGAIFRRGEEIIRPSQDCSRSYGYGLVLNRILKLSETEYAEMEIERIEPSGASAYRGIHSYCAVEQLMVLDARI